MLNKKDTLPRVSLLLRIKSKATYYCSATVILGTALFPPLRRPIHKKEEAGGHTILHGTSRASGNIRPQKQLNSCFFIIRRCRMVALKFNVLAMIDTVTFTAISLSILYPSHRKAHTGVTEELAHYCLWIFLRHGQLTP